MRRIVMWLAICQLAAVPLLPARAQEAPAPVGGQQITLAREIVADGFPPETRLDVFGAVMQQVAAQMNVAIPGIEDDPELQAIIDRFQQRALDTGIAILSRHMDAMMEGMAMGYAEVFTPAELQALHAYVTSPEGHGFLAKTAAINSHPAMIEASQGFLNEYMGDVPAMQEELRDEIVALLAQREGQ